MPDQPPPLSSLRPTICSCALAVITSGRFRMWTPPASVEGRTGWKPKRLICPIRSPMKIRGAVLAPERSLTFTVWAAVVWPSP